jgi:hypothetical protein
LKAKPKIFSDLGKIIYFAKSCICARPSLANIVLFTIGGLMMTIGLLMSGIGNIPFFQDLSRLTVQVGIYSIPEWQILTVIGLLTTTFGVFDNRVEIEAAF